MAIQWRWDEKCGEATFTSTYRTKDGVVNKVISTNLYVGNAYLVFIKEWVENDVSKYSLYTFWADKEHMKNCLGLNKKKGYTDNTLDEAYGKLVKIKLNKEKCRYTKEIVSALVQAFDSIEIEIYKEEEDDSNNK